MSYENATICVNGHVMSSINANSQPYCSVCGEETISVCQHCGAPIRGDIKSDIIFDWSYSPADFCYACGKPYPWVERAISATIELIELDEASTATDLDLLRSSLPGLFADGPVKELAIAKFRKVCSKVKPFTQNAVKNVLSSAVESQILAALFPQT